METTDLLRPPNIDAGHARSGQARVARRRGAGRSAIFAVLLVTTAFFLFPFFWVVTTSLQSTHEQQSLPLTWWPDSPQWHNFAVAWHVAPFTTYLLHTLAIVSLVTVGSVASASFVAYGLARCRFPGREFWFNAILSTMMLPGTVTLIPIYLLFKNIGWLDTYYPLIVPAFFGGGPFNIFLLRQFILGIPRELDEAARVDGAGHLRIYAHIILPSIKPALAVTGWMTALGTWGDLFGPLIFLSSPEKWTLALAIYQFPTMQPPGWGDQLVMSIALIVMIPVVVGFFFLQRWLIEGVNLTGVNR
ncbi:carbohydrate ABC transporter permease [Actinopolymorpha singaporensis]